MNFKGVKNEVISDILWVNQQKTVKPKVQVSLHVHYVPYQYLGSTMIQMKAIKFLRTPFTNMFTLREQSSIIHSGDYIQVFFFLISLNQQININVNK